MRLTPCLLVLCFVFLAGVARAAEIALIIDDMGNAQRDADAFSLPREIAFSILPHKKLSTTFSRRAAAQQREVMLHIPMESLQPKPLGPGAITADMHPLMIEETLLAALASVPDAVGVNNHMGSRLTQLTLPMNSTMEFLNQHRLYFVDSRTTRYSKAQRIAREHGVNSTRRNVFLDHMAEPRHIDLQFRRLVRLARKYGQAVGIGHPYPETLAYLQQALETLDAEGIQLVAPSDIIHTQEMARLQGEIPAP